MPWISTIILAATLVTARPGHGWLWFFYGASAVCWLCWFVLAHRRPEAGAGILVAAAVVPAMVTGLPSDGTAIILAAVVVGTYVSLPQPAARSLVLVVCLVVVVVGLSGVVWSRPVDRLAGNLGGVAIAVLIGLNRRQYLARMAQAEVSHREQLQTAAAEERTRIAREMHDVLAHSLGALRVQLEVTHTLLAEQGDTDRAVEYLVSAQRLAEQGLSDARDAISALREEVRSLPAVLAELAEAFGRDHQTAVEFRQHGGYRALSSPETVALSRIAKEAMTNAAKHAPGRAVAVDLDYREDGTVVVVRNQLDPAAVPDGEPAWKPARGYGLTGMRERIELVDGSLQTRAVLDHESGPCWEVRATVSG